LAAECLAIERLEAARDLHSKALRSEKPEAWHALRIGVKRFRYTVESLLPTRYEVWGDGLKHLQDLLGDTHDLDVLSDKIHEHLEGAPAESKEERIQSQRQRRIEKYRQLAVGTTRLAAVARRASAGGCLANRRTRTVARDRAGG
jgi:CHAD domain-containing protein